MLLVADLILSRIVIHPVANPFTLYAGLCVFLLRGEKVWLLWSILRKNIDPLSLMSFPKIVIEGLHLDFLGNEKFFCNLVTAALDSLSISEIPRF